MAPLRDGVAHASICIAGAVSGDALVFCCSLVLRPCEVRHFRRDFLHGVVPPPGLGGPEADGIAQADDVSPQVGGERSLWVEGRRNFKMLDKNGNKHEEKA